MELSKKSDLFLIKKVKKYSDSDAYLELKRRNEKSYYKVCEKYAKKVPALKYFELVEDVDFLINKSIQTYNPKKKTKFNTWVHNYSRYHILNTIKHLNEVGHFIPTENTEIDILNNNNNKHFLDTNEDLKDHVFQFLKSAPDKRVIKLFELRFYGDKSQRKWKHIASELKLSCQQVLNIYNKYKELLYKQMVKENNK
jgi:hypothetical protein